MFSQPWRVMRFLDERCFQGLEVKDPDAAPPRQYSLGVECALAEGHLGIDL
jgi:hypothetical protein